MHPAPITPAGPAAPIFTVGFSGSRSLIDVGHAGKAVEAGGKVTEHAAQVAAVRERTLGQIKEWLDTLAAIKRASGTRLAAVCSLAVGGDALFIEACRDLEIPVTVLLPQPLEEFLAATGSNGTADFTAGEAQAARDLARGAAGVDVAADSADRRERFEQVNAEIIRRCDLLYCLKLPTSGQPGGQMGGRGGTAHAAGQAQKAGKPVVEGRIPRLSEAADIPPFIIGIAAPEGFSQLGRHGVGTLVRNIFEWVRADPGQYRVDRAATHGTGLAPSLGLSRETPIRVLHHVSHEDEQWLANDIAGDTAEAFGLALTRVRPFHADTSIPEPGEFVAELAEDADRDLSRWRSKVQADRQDTARRGLREKAALEYLAAHSDLLVVVAGEAELDAGRASGTATLAAGSSSLVAARLRGPTPGLLPFPSPLTWADGGPLIAIRSDVTTGTADSHLRLWHPLDSRPHVFSPEAWEESQMELFREQVGQFGELNDRCATSGLLTAKDRKARIARLLPENPPAPFRPQADLERWAKRQVDWIGGQVVVDGKKVPRRPRLHDLAKRLFFDRMSLRPPSAGAPAAAVAGPGRAARSAPVALSGALTRLARFREEATALNRERYDKEIKRLALLFRRSAFLVILFLQFSEYKVELPPATAAASHAAPHPAEPKTEGGAIPASTATASHATPSSKDHHGEGAAKGGEQPGWVDVLQWSGFLAACALSAWIWRENWKKQRTRVDDWQNDTRALGEALRVQFYWTCSGTGESAASNYLQRAQSEVSWIRAVVANLVQACGLDRFAFARAGLAAQVESLRRVRHGWILDQSAYFEGKVHEFHREKQHHHLRGNLLLAAGFGLVFLGFLTAENRFHGLATVLQPHDAWGWAACLLAWPMAMVLAWLVSGWIDLKAWRAHRAFVDALGAHRTPGAPGHEPDPWIERVHRVHRVMHHWSAALVAGLALAVTLFGVVSATQAMLVRHHLHILPDPEEFLVHCKWLLWTWGGLDHWWVANKFFAENLRRYSAMAGLFRGADDRLRLLFDGLAGKTASTDETRRAVAEIQQIYVAVGREALNENADWLLMHRDKRLDPQLPAG